jgi:hypothetical protein
MGSDSGQSKHEGMNLMAIPNVGREQYLSVLKYEFHRLCLDFERNPVATEAHDKLSALAESLATKIKSNAICVLSDTICEGPQGINHANLDQVIRDASALREALKEG